VKQTFWEIIYKRYTRWARQRVRSTDPAKALQRLAKHGVTDSCPLVAAQGSVPSGVEARIAADMAAAWEMAATKKDQRLNWRMPWYHAVAFAVIIGVVGGQIARSIIHHVRYGSPPLHHVLVELLFLTVVTAVGVALGFATGEQRVMDRLCADWAERLGGAWGSSKLDQVVTWLETRWAWLLPPDLFANDVLWAMGARRGIPVLAILERSTESILFDTKQGVAARTRRNEKVRGGQWTRTNLFLQGVRFRDAEHKERVCEKLAKMGGGVIECPNGVYLYGPFYFMRLLRESGPTSEIWIDLVDQVIDADFHGSESAAKELHADAVAGGLVAPDGRLQ
jgi:hypothetical protein